jgi:hypothetical protein
VIGVARAAAAELSSAGDGYGHRIASNRLSATPTANVMISIKSNVSMLMSTPPPRYSFYGLVGIRSGRVRLDIDRLRRGVTRLIHTPNDVR